MSIYLTYRIPLPKTHELWTNWNRYKITMWRGNIFRKVIYFIYRHSFDTVHILHHFDSPHYYYLITTRQEESYMSHLDLENHVHFGVLLLLSVYSYPSTGWSLTIFKIWGRRGRDRMVVEFTTTFVHVPMQSVPISTNVIISNPAHDEV